MTIAYAALHRTVRYRDEDTGLYAAALSDGTVFFSRLPPALYDRHARQTPVREVLAGSSVLIKYLVERGINRMEAVQIVQEAEPDCPFEPVRDDGHL